MQIYILLFVDTCALEDISPYLCLFNEENSLKSFSSAIVCMNSGV